VCPAPLFFPASAAEDFASFLADAATAVWAGTTVAARASDRAARTAREREGFTFPVSVVGRSRFTVGRRAHAPLWAVRPTPWR